MNSNSAAPSLASERYVSPHFAEREWEGVWARSWLVIARCDEIPEAGDFLVEQVGRESIIIVRQEDETIKAFYNVCQHRGNQLVMVEEGSLAAFTCGYHGWRYALDGTCITAQDREDFRIDPCAHVRLSELRCETLGGFVWINMDAACEPLHAYLGPVAAGFERYPTQDYVRISAMSIRMPCNWKAAMDNFHEAYHIASAHPLGLHYMEDDYRDARTTLFENGHSLSAQPGSVRARRLPPGTPIGPQIAGELIHWGLDPADFADRPADTRLALQAQKRRLAAERGAHHYDRLTDEQLTDPHHYTIFPNLAVTFNPDGMLFLRATPHPTDPEQCVLDTWFYDLGQDSFWTKMLAAGSGDGGRGDHAPRTFVDYGTHDLGPILNDDAWVLAAQQRGLRSRGYKGALLAGQERRVSQYHDMIDRRIAELAA